MFIKENTIAAINKRIKIEKLIVGYLLKKKVTSDPRLRPNKA